MHPILAALQRARQTDLLPDGSSVLLAVSGGADSTALLYGADQIASAAHWRLAVGHVHHGWRGREADRDLSFVAEHARRLGLPFFFRRCRPAGGARSEKSSREARARQKRYASLAEMAREAGASRIATAHHRDDRVESFLLALERGRGLASAAGPRAKREDGVVRPFLSVSRRQILDFLKKRGIAFRRDASNGDLTLDRNRVRRALGRLEDRREDTLEALARLVEHLDCERRRIDLEFETRIRPSFSAAPGSVMADADLLASSPLPLARRALEEAALPFARPGRPPLTGTEREQILSRLAQGGDFRFEAGRRIRFERRGRLLTIGRR